ncbi:MAG: hypothetical protein GY851_03415 [bacterium]|nr:hypothetical protein [bacterium]
MRRLWLWVRVALSILPLLLLTFFFYVCRFIAGRYTVQNFIRNALFARVDVVGFEDLETWDEWGVVGRAMFEAECERRGFVPEVHLTEIHPDFDAQQVTLSFRRMNSEEKAEDMHRAQKKGAGFHIHPKLQAEQIERRHMERARRGVR